MKKKIIVLLVLLALLVPSFVYAKGEWSEWIKLEVPWGYNVKRIYDHENKLVCWVYEGGQSGGISCQPSLEMEHPTLRGITQ